MATQPFQPPSIALPPRSPLLANLPDEALGYMIERCLAELDFREGDIDTMQADGDELDGNSSEDDFMDHGAIGYGSAGCPISDPGEDDGDELDTGNAEDEGYASIVPGFPLFGLDSGPGCPISDPGELTGDEHDGTNAEDEIGNGSSDTGAGCPIADPGGCQHDGREEDDGV